MMLIMATSPNGIAEIIAKGIDFFTTFGNLGGLSIITFLFFIFLGYRFFLYKIREKEGQREKDLKEAKAKIETLIRDNGQQMVDYELKLKDIETSHKIDSIKEVSKLRSHPFFQSCEYWITRVEMFPIKDKFRHRVFVDYVRIFLMAGKEIWEELVEDVSSNIEELSTMELYSRVVKTLHRTNTLREQKCKEMMFPDVFLDKVSEEWNGPTEKLLFVCISSICNSDRFDSNANRLAVILNLKTSLYEIMVFEAESIIDELNGELEGASYKGMICCDKKH